MDPQTLQVVQQLRAEMKILASDVKELQAVANIGHVLVPPALNLTPSQQALLQSLMVRKVSSTDALYVALYGEDDRRDVKNVNAQLTYLRRKLVPIGVDIRRMVGRGWYLVQEDKDKIQALLDADETLSKRAA